MNYIEHYSRYFEEKLKRKVKKKTLKCIEGRYGRKVSG